MADVCAVVLLNFFAKKALTWRFWLGKYTRVSSFGYAGGTVFGLLRVFYE